ncbi:MAG TPA: PEP/pyruvate-binding domain-containing protein, partial [Dehalococcoidia bacterium]
MSAVPVVRWFDEIDPEAVAEVGGKGASLARLAREGFPVPPGFVITAEAYRAAASGGGDGPLPPPLAAEVLTAFERLRAAAGPDAAFAVRSSATAEDSGAASFAGQHRTYLNVRSPEELLQAVRGCWASLADGHARAYREALGVREERAAMAVVVQALVPAEVSGVAFTVDPVTGDDGVILIDASWGLGEAIVSGAVTPDHFRVRKRDLAVLERHIQEKTLRTVPADEGTYTEAVPPEEAARPCLTDGLLRELAHLVRTIEARYGSPQDVEWACAGGRLFVLQARPVTAVGGRGPEAGGWTSEFDTETDAETVWTAANIQEVLPGLITPLTWSVMRRGMYVAFNGLYRSVGVLEDREMDTPFVGLFYNRAFLNVSALRKVSDRSPLSSPEAVDEQFLGVPRPAQPPRRPLTWGRLRAYARSLPRGLALTAGMPRRVRREEARVARFLARLEALDPAALSPGELARLLREGLEVTSRAGATHIAVTAVASGAFETLRRVLERWLGGDQSALQAQLCTGLEGVASALPSYRIWDLSRLALASPAAREALTGPEGTAGALERLRAADDEGARRFLAALEAFLREFGHRGVMEGELSAPSWAEDPGYVLEMVANFLQADEAASPYRVHERQRREREAAERNVRARLNPVQRAVFNYVLGQAQTYVPLREATKSLLIKSGHGQRPFGAEVARRLAAMGAIDAADDYYYLTLEEALALLEQGPRAVPDARERVARRRAEYRRNAGVRLPESFTGRPVPLRDGDAPPEEGTVLRGIPVSPGRATGRARVILDPRLDARIQPGE